MVGAEWLNIQDIFALFLGPILTVYMAVATTVAILLTALTFVYRQMQVVIIRKRDEDD
jgi:hypothetical protein